MEDFTRGQIEIQGGELIFVTKFSVKDQNGAKVENTFRLAGSGVSFGPVVCTVSLTVKYGSSGPERDWLGMVINKQITQLVQVTPDGQRIPRNGAFSESTFTQELEGAGELALEFVGVAA
jgi:hypothetical protein